MYENYKSPTEDGITVKSLKAAFERIRLPKTETEVELIFRDADKDGNGVIDFEEFK
jgi:Ca2+-binding EF-hand superfamily protein